MQKYLVVVNQKFLVSVEAETNGGAEHRLLDLIPIEGAIRSCQAFSLDELKTEFFRVLVKDCKTISEDEFRCKCESYKKLSDIVNTSKSDVLQLEERIAHYMKEIEACKQSICSAHNNGVVALSELELIF